MTPREKWRMRSQRARTVIILICSLVLVTLLDIPLLHALYHEPLQHIQDHDWYRLLRIIGYLGTWLLMCIVYIAHDRHQHRGLAILFSAGLSGIVAELLKMTISRERPVIEGVIQPGLYHFRGLFSGFQDSSNLGLPSSHTAVAFGGCMMLACFLPRARTTLLLLALGCGITRMLTGAHFATDVFVGALVGWWCSRIIHSLASVHIPELRDRYRLPV